MGTEDRKIIRGKPQGEMEAQKKVDDLKNRVQAFNDKLIPLLAEFKLALGATAYLSPEGTIQAMPQVFDDSKVVAPENVPTDNSQVDAPATPVPPKPANKKSDIKPA